MDNYVSLQMIITPLFIFSKMKRQLFVVIMLLAGLLANAQEYKTVKDICFTEKNDAYAQERLKLDVYYAEGAKDCPVIVWFHGGGIEAGQKEIPEKLKDKGFVVIDMGS